MKTSKSVLKYAVDISAEIRSAPFQETSAASIMRVDITTLPEVRSVSCRLPGKTCHGLGIVNGNKGMEFVDKDLTAAPVTLKCPGITFLPMRKDHRSGKLCVFFGMADYLAYQSLRRNGFVRLPSDCDAVIMSDVRNFVHVAVEGDDYKTVYLYFPNDVTSSTITKTLKQRYGKRAVVCNPLYKGYDNLLHFVKAIETTTNT